MAEYDVANPETLGARELLRLRVEKFADDDFSIYDSFRTANPIDLIGIIDVEDRAALMRNPRMRRVLERIPQQTSQSIANLIVVAAAREQFCVGILEADRDALRLEVADILDRYRFDRPRFARILGAIARTPELVEFLATIDELVADSIVVSRVNDVDAWIIDEILDVMRGLPVRPPELIEMPELDAIVSRDLRLWSVRVYVRSGEVDTPDVGPLLTNPAFRRFVNLPRVVSIEDAALLRAAVVAEPAALEYVASLENLSAVAARRQMLDFQNLFSLARDADTAARLSLVPRALATAVTQAVMEISLNPLLYAMGESPNAAPIAVKYRQSEKQIIDLTLVPDPKWRAVILYARGFDELRRLAKFEPNIAVMLADPKTRKKVLEDADLVRSFWSADVAAALRAAENYRWIVFASQGEPQHVLRSDLERLEEAHPLFTAEVRLRYLSLARALGMTDTVRYQNELATVEWSDNLSLFRRAINADALAVLANTPPDRVGRFIARSTFYSNPLWFRAARSEYGLARTWDLARRAATYTDMQRSDLSPAEFLGALEWLAMAPEGILELHIAPRAYANALRHAVARKYLRGEIGRDEFVSSTWDNKWGSKWLLLHRAARANQLSGDVVLPPAIWGAISAWLSGRPVRAIPFSR